MDFCMLSYSDENAPFFFKIKSLGEIILIFLIALVYSQNNMYIYMYTCENLSLLKFTDILLFILCSLFGKLWETFQREVTRL